MTIFPSFFLGNIGQENVFYDILERKNAFLCYKNKKIKKSKNWHFSKGVKPWFWSKNDNCSNFFFQGNIGQENVFCNIGERKNASVGIVLGQKWPLFQLFWGGNIGQENVFYNILERKNVFQGHKNKKLKKWKNWNFLKELNQWFRSKNGNYSNCFF